MASLGLFCPVTSRVKGYPFEVALPEAGGVNGVVLEGSQQGSIALP